LVRSSNHVGSYYTNKTLSSLSAELLAIDKALDHVISLGMPRTAIVNDYKNSAIAIEKASPDN